tara:strand:+ start:886 stop:1857 length:972 start_codon:yes stop_codon:yes gene_type:complete
MKILLTGCAGFIGYHLTIRLNKLGHKVYGVDNLNNYYSVNLKKDRIKELKKNKLFYFKKLDILNKKKLEKIFKKKIDIVINLAAQAGVQFSFKKPSKYINSNIIGFYNILELSNKYNIKKILFASSSSVYGSIKKKKFSENLKVDSQISLYAATKKSNETLASYYANNFGITILCMRFFTVYGPLGRPDMSYFKFSDLHRKKKQISLYNNGNHTRDFTYIMDSVDIIQKLIKVVRNSRKLLSGNFFDIVNVACGKRIHLRYLVKLLEENFNSSIKIKYLPLQKGDVKNTFSDSRKLKKYIGKINHTKFSEGIRKFCDWYKDYY